MLIYKTLYKTSIEYSTLHADRNASFYSLPDTVVPSTAKPARTMDPLVMNEQLVKGGESRIQKGKLAWVLENAKQLTGGWFQWSQLLSCHLIGTAELFLNIKNIAEICRLQN